MTNGIIYMFTNKVNGMKYVGQTIRERARYRAHINRCESFIDRAITKYGIENFEYDVLHRCNGTRENVIGELNFFEKKYIKKYDCICPNGYNMTSGGDNPTLLSEESRKRISESHKGIVPWNKGLSKETNERLKELSDKSKGRVSPLKGRKLGQFSEEHKRKLSESALNRKPMSEETKKKIAEASKKMWETASQEKKDRMHNKGKIMSDEARANMSKAKLDWWENKRKNNL